MDRRTFLASSLITTAGMAAGLPGDPIIGHGNFKYRINTNWCSGNPQQYPVKNCHEMVIDHTGKIYMTTDDTRNNIVIFNKDGKILSAWGHEYPGAHGLTLHDENGEEFLYIADYERHQVIKTRLDGTVVKVFEWPADAGVYGSQTEFKPTETAIAPNGDVVVADGYGKNYIIQYGQDGSVKKVFGGPEHLKNAHGIALDKRNKANPQWLVTSRADNKLKIFDMNGGVTGSVDLPGAYICRPVVHGSEVYFAVLISKLPWDSQSGFVLILNENNRPVSAPGGSNPIFRADGTLEPLYQTVQVFKHPHDVLVDRDGNIYVTQWNSGSVYPYRLERV